jgi:two-component system LytT family sensor kinase
MQRGVNKYIGFKDIYLMVLGIPVLGFIIPYVFFHLNPFDEQIPFGYFIGSCVHTGIYWLGDRYLFILLRKKWPSITDFKKRLAFTGASIFIYTTCFCFVGASLINPMMQKDLIPSLQNLTALDYNIASLTATVVIGAIYETIYILYQLKHVLVEREKLKKENLQSQLEILKNQVNPHFLFNSLNTLASVIPEDPKMAVDFVQNLSAVYRYILEIRNRELITISEELECIRAYEFLLRIRFGESLNLKIDLEPVYLEKQIVPLSLQMLLENAIKHNVVSKKRPLEISISIVENRVLVMNNLQPKIEPEKSTKTGLENIRKRYQLLSGKSIDVIQGSKIFTVALPLIETEAYASIDN